MSPFFTAWLAALLSAVSLAPALAAAPPPAVPAAPPVAAVRPHTDTYFGTPIVDNYQWLENLNSPEVQAWFRGQADYTQAALARIPGRAALLADIKRLDNTGERVYNVQTANGRAFYLKSTPRDNNARLYVRAGFRGPERLLLNPDTLAAKPGTHYAVDYFAPALDGAHVAVGVSPGGSENSVLRVLDVRSGKMLSDVIDRAEEGSPSWLPDNRSFFYNRLKKLAPGESDVDKYKDGKACLHVLGRSADNDTVIVARGLSPRVALEDTDFPFVTFAPNAPGWAFAVNDRGVQNEIALYAAPLSAAKRGGASVPWREVAAFTDAVTGYDAHGDTLYLLSHKGASRFQVWQESLARPGFTTARVVVPAGRAVIRGIVAAPDALYLHDMDGGIGQLRRLPYAGGPAQSIPMPVANALDATLVTDPQRPGTLFVTESGTASPRWYAYNPQTRKVADTHLLPPVPVDFSPYTETTGQAKSADGTLVPVSIISPKGMTRDGTHPALLEGYGSYGIVDDLAFQRTLPAWLSRGGVYAVAHVRGGGEYGEDWYRAGQKAAKRHTWEDFEACAQYLIDKGYTSSAHLAGTGTSAGGITIGRAITDKPSLFGAALIRVGATNALRDELQPNGPDNIPEFGTVTTPGGFRDLREMDAYQHVQDGTPYPAVMVVTGINDPRVSSWEPAKMAARLQAATSSGKPVLLRVDYDAGHGFGSTKAQTEADLADEWSFLLWQLGQSGFQPAP